MLPSEIVSSSLWRTAFVNRKDTFEEKKRQVLESQFKKLRENMSFLTAEISRTIPELTVHDITHLDALWETASTIAGSDYPINPLEGFVLGAAFLCHDSAHCFEAYSGGKDAVKNSVSWSDNYALAKKDNPEAEDKEIEKIVTFNTLRELHAEQAERLLLESWNKPDSTDSLYLLEDRELRSNLAVTIGKIAASHHWDIEKVCQNFKTPYPAPTNYPTDWRIDALKLALILRCADAAHIDDRRAPDFLHALIHRSGISLEHWRAQNNLSRIYAVNSNKSKAKAIIRSKHPFEEAQSTAWWVAYDAVKLLDKEIKASQEAIREYLTDVPEFYIEGVKGVESPAAISEFIETKGWLPIASELHVSNIESLVSKLGGTMLYGNSTDKLEVALRELIQNARDAIIARRSLDNGFIGKITIRLVCEDECSKVVVEDDGVGMSERVLTGPLLDFGTSFWTSSLVKSELPGLASSSFSAVGCFGIGFYATFMCSDSVLVSSKRYDQGVDATGRLHFKNGLSFRPLFAKGVLSSHSVSVSTRVELNLSSEYDLSVPIQINPNNKAENYPKTSFENYIAAICSGLDVNVDVVDVKNGTSKTVHYSIDNNFDYSEWLQRISFSPEKRSKFGEYIKQHKCRLRALKNDNKIVGLAALYTGLNQTDTCVSHRTVGGLAHTVHTGRTGQFIGFLDYETDSARRNIVISKPRASHQELERWGEEQIRLLKDMKISHSEWHAASSNLCQLGIDPINVANALIKINGKSYFCNIDQLAEFSLKWPIIFYKASGVDVLCNTVEARAIKDCVEVISIVNSKYNGIEWESDTSPVRDYSLVGCFLRKLDEKNYKVNLDIKTLDLMSVFGRLVELKFTSSIE